MNEQLQKELLDILRALKDGASPAWQVLVEQRSAYAWAMFVACMVSAVICAVVCLKVGRNAVGRMKDLNDFAPIPLLIAALVSLIGFALAMVNAVAWLPVAVAPLGQLLGMVVR